METGLSYYLDHVSLVTSERELSLNTSPLSPELKLYSCKH